MNQQTFHRAIVTTSPAVRALFSVSFAACYSSFSQHRKLEAITQRTQIRFVVESRGASREATFQQYFLDKLRWRCVCNFLPCRPLAKHLRTLTHRAQDTHSHTSVYDQNPLNPKHKTMHWKLPPAPRRRTVRHTFGQPTTRCAALLWNLFHSPGNRVQPDDGDHGPDVRPLDVARCERRPHNDQVPVGGDRELHTITGRHGWNKTRTKEPWLFDASPWRQLFRAWLKNSDNILMLTMKHSYAPLCLVFLLPRNRQKTLKTRQYSS